MSIIKCNYINLPRHFHLCVMARALHVIHMSSIINSVSYVLKPLLKVHKSSNKHNYTCTCTCWCMNHHRNRHQNSGNLSTASISEWRTSMLNTQPWIPPLDWKLIMRISPAQRGYTKMDRDRQLRWTADCDSTLLCHLVKTWMSDFIQWNVLYYLCIFTLEKSIRQAS